MADFTQQASSRKLVTVLEWTNKIRKMDMKYMYIFVPFPRVPLYSLALKISSYEPLCRRRNASRTHMSKGVSQSQTATVASKTSGHPPPRLAIRSFIQNHNSPPPYKSARMFPYKSFVLIAFIPRRVHAFPAEHRNHSGGWTRSTVTLSGAPWSTWDSRRFGLVTARR